MPALQVKNVSPELHDRVRARARFEGMSVGEYILDALRRDLAVPSARAWEAQVGAREPVEGADVVSALHDARRERDDEIAGALRRR